MEENEMKTQNKWIKWHEGHRGLDVEADAETDSFVGDLRTSGYAEEDITTLAAEHLAESLIMAGFSPDQINLKLTLD